MDATLFGAPDVDLEDLDAAVVRFDYQVDRRGARAELKTEESRRAVEDMVGRVRAEFRVRLEKNHWLTAATRAMCRALETRESCLDSHPTKPRI